MNTDILRNAGIEYDSGVKRFMGRAHLYEKALAKFPKDGAFARIQQAFADDDPAQLLANAHEMKGMCGNIALNRLSELAANVVSLLRSGTATPEDIRQAYLQLETEYTKTRDAILTAMEEIAHA